MSEEKVEKIRSFLRKTILPLDKKWEAWKSKVHLSLELQISIRYMMWMAIFGALVFIPVGYVLFHSNLDELHIVFRYNEHDWDFELTSLYYRTILLYLIGMLVIVRLSKKNMHGIAKKMQDIIKSTKRITINNLENERLNLEGTQNELRDIAGTINGMLDRLELSYETQKQFVSDASHELRTPISVIQGYVNMLDRWGAEDAEVLKESVNAIKNEAQSMQELVEKLLFLSRHDKKTLKLHKKKFDVGNLLQEIFRESKVTVKERNIEALDMDSVVLYGDAQTIKEAIRVLYENAIKYTQSGDTIYMGCEQENENCVITIADTGIGMDEKDMDNIFRRFYRSDHVQSSNISGHGLGLSIAKLIVLKHAGMIEVKSQYTRGTCFRIVLPLKSY